MHSARSVVAGALLLGLGGLSDVAKARPIDDAPRVASARADSDNYTVELKAAPSYKAGEGSSLEVAILSKGSYHINPQFPIRFKANAAPDNVTYEKSVLKREDGHFDDKTGSFKLGFTAAKAGSYNLGGTLSLSICSEKNCLMEKVAVDVDVTVK